MAARASPHNPLTRAREEGCRCVGRPTPPAAADNFVRRNRGDEELELGLPWRPMLRHDADDDFAWLGRRQQAPRATGYDDRRTPVKTVSLLE